MGLRLASLKAYEMVSRRQHRLDRLDRLHRL